MKFKPIPDSVRCATLEAKWLTVTMNANGKYSVYATDSDYVQSMIIEPSIEGQEAYIYCNPEPVEYPVCVENV